MAMNPPYECPPASTDSQWTTFLSHCTQEQLDEMLRVLQLGQDYPAWEAVILETRNRLHTADERRRMDLMRQTASQHERH